MRLAMLWYEAGMIWRRGAVSCGLSDLMDVLCRVIETHLDDFVAREFEVGDVGCVAGHQVTIEDA